ncbi:hypothetical protein [Viridibacterium curvum]|uniref:Alginate biosynthesis protein AlgF n=1 Tax=Viridibacterium curvum TaxID=1101404 RepID=A0ABP9Q6X9_9RHOO
MKLHAMVVATAMAFASPVFAQADAALLTASFQSENVFTAAFKALPNDAAKPFFVVAGGTAQVEAGKLVLANGRITMGAVADADGKVAASTPDARPAGVLDLSKPYKVIVKVSEAQSLNPGKDTFTIYVNNSTAKQSDSPLGKDSQLVKVSASTLKVGDNVFEGKVGDAKSFLQLRAESGASVKIESVRVVPM